MYNKQGLPSNGKFGKDHVYIRPFTVGDLALAHRAKVENNMTHIIDLVDRTIKEDVRDLTVPDMVYCMAWLRMNSYPTTPFRVEWTCANNHKNLGEIKKSNLDIKLCESSKYEEVDLYYPTVRDMEYIHDVSDEVDVEMKWLLEKAQFLSPSLGTLDERVKFLKDPSKEGMELIGMISSFKEDMLHGITETANLCCKEEECDYHSGVSVVIPMKLTDFFPTDF